MCFRLVSFLSLYLSVVEMVAEPVEALSKRPDTGKKTDASPPSTSSGNGSATEKDRYKPKKNTSERK